MNTRNKTSLDAFRALKAVVLNIEDLLEEENYSAASTAQTVLSLRYAEFLFALGRDAEIEHREWYEKMVKGIGQ